MGEAGEPPQRFGRNKFRLTPELHAADHGGQVYIAAALAGADNRALDMHCTGKNRSPGIGYAEPAIGVPVKPKMRPGIIAYQPFDHTRNLIRIGPSGGIADHDAAHSLARALRRHLVEIVDRARSK